MDRRLAALADAELKAVLAPFGAERTLPGAAYTSPDVYEWEREVLWDQAWLAIGRTADFPDGSTHEVAVGSESLIVTCDSTMRAFFNVCRHRGHEILGRGERCETSSLRCPYHGWVYGVGGELRAAPKMHHRSELDTVRLGEVRLETWHGWAFVALDDAAPTFAEYVGDLGSQIEAYSPAHLVVGARTNYEIAANWKLIHENYHECYHCASIHPQLTAVSNPDSGDNLTPAGAWIGGSLQLRPGVETLSLDGRSRGCRIPGLPDALSGEAQYLGLIPNLLISLHPDYAITHRLEAQGPDSTTIHCEWLFPKEAIDEPGFDPGYAVDFWDITNKQDWQACESLQKGAASRGFRPGMLGSGEDAVYQFQGAIARAYLGQGVLPAANPGRR